MRHDVWQVWWSILIDWKNNLSIRFLSTEQTIIYSKAVVLWGCHSFPVLYCTKMLFIFTHYLDVGMNYLPTLLRALDNNKGLAVLFSYSLTCKCIFMFACFSCFYFFYLFIYYYLFIIIIISALKPKYLICNFQCNLPRWVVETLGVNTV